MVFTKRNGNSMKHPRDKQLQLAVVEVSRMDSSQQSGLDKDLIRRFQRVLSALYYSGFLFRKYMAERIPTILAIMVRHSEEPEKAWAMLRRLVTEQQASVIMSSFFSEEEFPKLSHYRESFVEAEVPAFGS